ncbi:MAG: hypothetical protein DRK00_04840 [Thermoprotei archaeon]|nr:MAG: hypothetical protein DRK00_04840 [Thermoprotei archaeon]
MPRGALLLLALLLPACLAGTLADAEGVASAYDPSVIYEGGWMHKPFWVLRSAASPAWLMRARSDRLLFFYGIRRWGRGPPTCFYVKTRSGVVMFERGESVEGVEMTAPWIVVSFAGSEGWELFDVPWLIYLQRRPLEVRLTDEYLEIRFEGNDTGYVAAMPLYGYLKPPQDAYASSPIFGSKARAVRTWEWRRLRTLPEEVVERCEFWCRTFLRYPAGMWETYYINTTGDVVVIREEYKWLSFEDEWGTKPLRFAPISPTLALAIKYGFPAELSHELYDPDFYTPYGPLMGALETDVVEIRMHVLQYVNEMEAPKMPDPHDPVALRALERLREVMRERFPRPGEFDIDHGGGIWSRDPRETNYCWAVMGDIWYCRALPYLDEGLRRIVKPCLRKYFRDFVLTLKPYDPHRGKLLLHGPGIGSWGSWGDAGKFSTNLIQTIWAYAQFTGDWELIRERWDLVKRLFVLPDEMRWQGWGRYSIAEMGDMAPPCAAMARLAWGVGDLEYYGFAAYCFAKELAVHYVMSLGAEYFYEHRPHDRPEPMDEEVFLTNIWGETAGWQIDGPRYPRETPERQYMNRWVRFQCPDTARFYREVEPLHRAVERELNDPEVGWGRWRGRECRDDSHILPSLVRIRSLLLDEPPEKLAEVCKPEDVVGPPSGVVAAMIAFIRTSTPHEYVRLVPRGIYIPPRPGLDRTGGWRYGVVEPVYDPDLVVTLRGPWATPVWRFWSGDGGDLYFGAITPFPEMCEGFTEEVPLSWISGVKWFEPVKRREEAPPESSLRVEWLVIGPFPNRMDESLTEDEYPPELWLNESYEYEGRTYAWRAAVGPVIDLHSLLGTDWGIAYLLNYVYSPRSMKAYLALGSTGGCRAWINDELVFSWHKRHGEFVEDRHWVVVNLSRGWNKILIKVEGAWGRWMVSCKLLYGDGMPIDGLVWNPYHGFAEAKRPLVRLANLTLSKEVASLGERVTVSLDVANLGGAPATLSLELRVDGQLVASQQLRLEPGSSTKVEFVINTSEFGEGLHRIEVDGLEASLRVIRGGWSLTALSTWLAVALIAILTLIYALKRAGH